MLNNKVTLELTEYEAREINLSLNSTIEYFKEHGMEENASEFEQLRSIIRKQANISK